MYIHENSAYNRTSFGSGSVCLLNSGFFKTPGPLHYLFTWIYWTHNSVPFILQWNCLELFWSTKCKPPSVLSEPKAYKLTSDNEVNRFHRFVQSQQEITYRSITSISVGHRWLFPLRLKASFGAVFLH